VPPPGAEAYEPFYMPLSGTSMASPHVAGAVAVLQSKAQSVLGRRLTPDEVRRLLVESAVPMAGKDGLYDWPCGSLPIFVECGTQVDGTTGKAYERWQVGAGYLNVAAALARVESLGAAAPTGGTAPRGNAAPALPSVPPAGSSSAPVRTTLPPARGGRQDQNVRAKRRTSAKRRYARCVRSARKKSSRRARARAKARCKRTYRRAIRATR
jgi:subtilisin family serine protease